MAAGNFFRRQFMNNLNSILIEGNLVREPLLRATPKGTSVCTFRLASNRYFKQDAGYEKEVSFFDVQTWSRLADACYNLGKKGRGVRVVGRLKEDRWSSSDGKPHSKVTIVAEHVEFRPMIKKEDEKTAAATIAENTALAEAAASDPAALAAETAAACLENPSGSANIPELEPVTEEDLAVAAF
jgi:single-strand DNA-binding protein